MGVIATIGFILHAHLVTKLPDGDNTAIMGLAYNLVAMGWPWSEIALPLAESVTWDASPIDIYGLTAVVCVLVNAALVGGAGGVSWAIARRTRSEPPDSPKGQGGKIS